MRANNFFHRFSPGVGHYLFAGVLILRLISLSRLSRSPLFLPSRGDMHFYNEWALGILKGGTVNGAFYGLPLYPYILAGIYKIFGYSPFVPGVLQSLLDAATAVLIYQLVLHLVGPASGQSSNRVRSDDSTFAGTFFATAAALAWAFYMPAQAYSIILMPTAAFVCLFWWIVKRIVTSESAPTPKETFRYGLLIGLAAMAIASSLFLVPLIIFSLFLKRAPETKRLFLSGATLFTGIFLATSPCWIHNFFFARDPVFLSAHSGVNFWIGNNPEANGYPKFPPGLRAGQAAMLQDSIDTAEAAAGHSLKRSEVSAFWSNRARKYIAQHPAEWLSLLAVKIRNFWNAFQYDDLSIISNLREQRVIFPGFSFGLIAALGLPAMLMCWRRNASSRWITAAIFLQMCALLTVFVTERYRLVVVPGLLVLAATGLYLCWRSLFQKNHQGVALYFVALVAAVLFVSWPQHQLSLWALDAYNSGWQALESGNYPLAEKKLSLARRYVPTNPETNFAIGNLRLAQGRAGAAADFYRLTLRYDQQHRGALNNLGVLALDAKQYDEAETWLRQAERLDERNAKTHFLIAKALLGKGDRDRAEAEAARAVALGPEQPEFAQLRDQLQATR
jgi:tetratricopeptide (TPR) repeat protein